MEFRTWLYRIEEGISSSIRNCSPRAWDENHISDSWLQNLTHNLQNVTITDISSHFSIEWDAYKAVGALEKDHGDIAFLVKLTFPHQTTSIPKPLTKPLIGVAFLEAKRS
ncbi:MAG: hypothetical protein HC835_12155 [Oscillatoriales cyanobacterium RM2_1_1]|nr:hypothetical protein [Oscillatoriales cyanobacterium SM2_3_0]NJO46313.1 hypothetical protein [Oscillatoriales cyanobacterium RM2_1_1]